VAVLFALLACVSPSALRAQFASYTSLSEFQAAVGFSETDSFDDLTQDAFEDSPLSRAFGSFGYSATADGGLYVVGSGSDAWLSTNVAFSRLTFDALTGSVIGIGAYVFGTDIDGVPLSGVTLLLRATNSVGQVHEQLLVDASASGFFGVVALDDVLTSYSLEVAGTGSDLEYLEDVFATANGFVLAGEALPGFIVPEPDARLLLFVALVTMFLARLVNRVITRAVAQRRRREARA
jgi:hypothetical protein